MIILAKVDNVFMKVLDLQCDLGHCFEGWFGSEADYANQQQRGLLTCPVCASASVSKMPSAPRLNFGASQPTSVQQETPLTKPETVPVKQDLVTGGAEQMLQAAWLQVARQILKQTEDVGSQFAEEARKIHYGESPQRGIRGQATRDETESLLEEGIEVMPLALPESLKGPLQ